MKERKEISPTTPQLFDRISVVKHNRNSSKLRKKDNADLLEDEFIEMDSKNSKTIGKISQ